jgi:aryl-alcohol dehydrogenase-like predicted oxidoreductase
LPEYVKLGRTGVKVSTVCLGSDHFGFPHGADESVSHRIIGRALDAGINFIDTADSYNEGKSEEFIGSYLAKSGRRDQVVLATKFRSRTGPGPNDAGGSRYHISRAVEGSLRRLKTDRIDLYYIHAADPTTPLDETVSALDVLVRQGKVLYIGCSNFAAWQLAKSLWISDVRLLARFDAIQSVFNIVQPGLGREVVPLAIQEGVAVVPYSPLASGFLTGKQSRTAPRPDSKIFRRDEARGNRQLTDRYYQEPKLRVVDELQAIAAKFGQPVVRLALHWVMQSPGITSPIFGARTEEQLTGTIDAWRTAPPPEAMAAVKEVADEFAASAPMDYPPPPPPL